MRVSMSVGIRVNVEPETVAQSSYMTGFIQDARISSSSFTDS